MAPKVDSFYAVRVGRQKGVYRTWDDCRKQTNGFPKAQFKKFDTLAAAEAFAGCSLASTAAVASSVSPAAVSAPEKPVVFFYAVRAGRVPGIYNTWEECRNQTDEFKGAVYKKHATLSLAQAYLDKKTPRAAVNMDLPVGPIAMARSTSASPSTVSSTPTAPAVEEVRIYTDGSCPDNVGAASTQGKAGWGIAVLGPLGWQDFYGPVVFEKRDPLFLGATCGTNNTGELCGIAMALRWLSESSPGQGPARILYDSKYAANIAQGKWKATQNVELARNVQACHKAVVNSGRPLVYEKVKGHSGDVGNDRADHNADLGAFGSSKLWTRPKNTSILATQALDPAKRKLDASQTALPFKRARVDGPAPGITVLPGPGS